MKTSKSNMDKLTQIVVDFTAEVCKKFPSAEIALNANGREFELEVGVGSPRLNIAHDSVAVYVNGHCVHTMGNPDEGYDTVVTLWYEYPSSEELEAMLEKATKVLLKNGVDSLSML